MSSSVSRRHLLPVTVAAGVCGAIDTLRTVEEGALGPYVLPELENGAARVAGPAGGAVVGRCDPGSSQRRGVTGLKRCEYPQATELGDRGTRGKRPSLSGCRNAPSGW